MIKKTLKYLINFAVMYSLAIGSAVVYETHFMYNYKGSSVVMLTSNGGGGTGFRITAESGKSFILTNNHICRDRESLTANYGDQEKTIKVIQKYADHDLCVLEDIDEIPSLRLSGSLDSHERLWLIGHPALRQLTLESGHFVGNTDIDLLTTCSEKEIEERIAAIKEVKTIDDFLKILRLSAGYCIKKVNANHINNISYGGNSGSPVFNKWGNVVGVLFAGSRGQPTASYIVPLEHLQKFLKDL